MQVCYLKFMPALPDALSHHILRPKSAAPEAAAPDPTPEPTPSTPAAPEIPKATQADFIEGGSGKQEVSISQETKDKLIDRLSIKAKHARTAQDRQQEISPIDTYLLNTDVIQRLESGQLSAEDYKIALLDIHDEIYQKSFSQAKIIEGSSTAKRSVADVLRRNPSQTDVNFEDIPNPVKEGYAQELGNMPVPDQELTELHVLRQQLDAGLFGEGFKDPLYVAGDMSVYPDGLLHGSRHDVYREIGRQVDNIIEDRVKAGLLPRNETAQHLWAVDRTEMARVLIEANHRTLEMLTLDTATSILSKTPEINGDVIKKHAETLKRPPTPEDLTLLEQTQADSEAALVSAKDKADKTQEALLRTEEQVRLAGALQKKAVAKYEQLNEKNTAQITRLQSEATTLYHKLTELGTVTVPAGEKGTKTIGPGDSIKASIKDIEDKISAYEAEITASRNARIDADIDLESTQNHLDRLRGEEVSPPTTPPTYSGGELEAAKTELTNAQAQVNTARDSLKTKQEEFASGASPESRQKADDLEKCNTVYEKTDLILQTQRRQQSGDEYTLDRLSNDSIRPDGHVDGAERIRESIYMVADPENYSPEQARRLLSDEALIRAVIHIYEINTGTVFGHSGRTLRRIELSIEDHQRSVSSLENIPEGDRDPMYNDRLEAARNTLSTESLEFTRGVISKISTTNRVAMMRLQRFIIEQGGLSAMKGEPSLAIDKYFYDR